MSLYCILCKFSCGDWVGIPSARRPLFHRVCHPCLQRTLVELTSFPTKTESVPPTSQQSGQLETPVQGEMVLWWSLVMEINILDSPIIIPKPCIREGWRNGQTILEVDIASYHDVNGGHFWNGKFLQCRHKGTFFWKKTRVDYGTWPSTYLQAYYGPAALDRSEWKRYTALRL